MEVRINAHWPKSPLIVFEDETLNKIQLFLSVHLSVRQHLLNILGV